VARTDTVDGRIPARASRQESHEHCPAPSRRTWHQPGRPLLLDQRSRVDRPAGGARRARHVLHDGLHRHLNPIILTRGVDIEGAVIGGDPDTAFVKVAAATALVAGVLSILMGLVANFPLALAAGSG
jgi:hypothetical protein